MLEIVPMTLREANAFVEQNHRHHGPVAGHVSVSFDQFWIMCKECGWEGPYKSNAKEATSAWNTRAPRAEKAEREMDAAVERIKEDHWCENCKFQPTYSLCKNDGNCEDCESPCFCEGCKDGSLWEWSGKEE